MRMREIVQRVVWNASKDGKRVEIFYNSVDHPKFPANKMFARAKATQLWR